MTPSVAVVIPSLEGRVDALRESLARQTLRPAEVEVVRGVRPNGRARNLGVARTTAPLLVFIDDDALPGADDLLERLVAPLLADQTVGVTGAAKLLPPGAPPFQRWAAREVPRIVHPVVAAPLETNPDPPSFYCEITTTCCAMRRAVFAQAGGFDETLVRGVDTEFFVRVRRLVVDHGLPTGDHRRVMAETVESTAASPWSAVVGPSSARAQHYRFLLVPYAWAYHPAPATLRALLRKQFMYGIGHAQEVRRDPSRARGRTLHTPLHAVAFLLFRTAALLPNVFLPYSYAAPSWRPGFKPLKAAASYAAALGYVWGWYAARP